VDYRILKECKLLGKQRVYNDKLTAAEVAQIPSAAWEGLRGEGYVEPDVDMKPPEGLTEEIQHLHARMDQIHEAIAEVIGILKDGPQPEKRGRGRPPKQKE